MSYSKVFSESHQSGRIALPEEMGARKPHLIWIFPAPIAERLDSATWLDTTRELRQKGWEVTLIAMGDASTKQVKGVEVLCIPKPDVYLFGQALFHYGVVRHIFGQIDDVDVIMFHQESGIWLSPLKGLRSISRKQRPLLVMDTRDLIDIEPGDLKTALRRTYEQLNHRLAGLFADGQTTITKRFVDLVEIHPDNLLGIWPSGVDPNPFAAAAKARTWPQEVGSVRLVYVGIILQKRHLLELCTAVCEARRRGWIFELFIVGGGPDASQLVACVDSSDGAVTMVPPVAHDSIPDLLATMHVGVTSLPDVDDMKYAASSPIKLFEYMVSGMPVLATSNPCHTDVVASGDYVFWIDEPSESGILAGLQQIWERRTDLSELGKQARQAAGEWTWAAAAAKLDAALRNGLDRNAN